MSENKPKFHEGFHKFLIYFAMWVFPLIGIYEGISRIGFTYENGARYPVPITIFCVALILASLFAIKARFDLAAFRKNAPKEILWSCIVAGVMVFLINWLLDYGGADDSMGRAWGGLIVVLWGIAISRYYNDRPYLFRD